MSRATSSMTPDELKAHRVRQVELLISNLLRVGVIASLAVVTIGTVVSFVHHPDYIKSSPALTGLTSPGGAFPHTIADAWSALREGRGQAIVVFGLLLLIATPVVRVAVSIVAFAYERDRAFMAITSTVLILLLLSFFLGKGG